jgi:metal-responsive CopG/Arc/MetJ family transcriptional regulator
MSIQNRNQKPVQITMHPVILEAVDAEMKREGQRGRSSMLRKMACLYIAGKMKERGEDESRFLQEAIR